jgi:hypothetical protein
MTKTRKRRWVHGPDNHPGKYKNCPICQKAKQDIDWQQRYSEHEQPAIAEYLGYSKEDQQ